MGFQEEIAPLSALCVLRNSFQRGELDGRRYFAGRRPLRDLGPPQWRCVKRSTRIRDAPGATSREPPFASLSLGGPAANAANAALRWRGGLDAAARRWFSSIDAAGKGHITEADLRAYAAAQGLPAAYVRPFMDALARQRVCRRGAAPAPPAAGAAAAAAAMSRAIPAGGGGGCVEDSSDGGGEEVGFRRFRTFVVAREQGLRQAFELFDTDRDGAISADDLDLSLRHVTICCPNTRCVLRCRRQAVDALLAKLGAPGGSGGCGDPGSGGADAGSSSSGGSVGPAAGAGGARAWACEAGSRGTSVSSSSSGGSNRSSSAADGGGGGGQRVTFEQFRNYFSLLPEADALMAVEYWLAASSSSACADTGARVTVHEAARRGSPWGHLFAGAVAGAVSRTATAPLETLRLAAMAGALPAGGRIDALAAALVARHGWRALYKGNAVNVLRSAPQKALDFFAFDLYKSFFAGAAGGAGSGGAGGAPPRDATLRDTFLAAGLAGATSCLLLYPLDVARTRMTLDAAGRYRGVRHCLSAVAAAEGAGALFRGLGPSLAAILPEASITYGLHDLLKRTYRRVYHEDPGIGPSLAAGVLSASIGQLVAYPLETLSRRMQLGAATPPAAAAAAAATAAPALALAPAPGALAGAPRGTAGAWALAAQLVRAGGVRALYAGVGAATLRLVPMAVVSFGVYEGARAALMRAEAAWDRHTAELQVRQLHRGSRGSSGDPLLVLSRRAGGGSVLAAAAAAPAACTASATASRPGLAWWAPPAPRRGQAPAQPQQEAAAAVEAAANPGAGCVCCSAPGDAGGLATGRAACEGPLVGHGAALEDSDDAGRKP